ncbi:MAG TPA: IS3 family transposase, partial [Bacteroidales bacterium]|nr:IS3 family transposase [Bacteroidales bacterium]
AIAGIGACAESFFGHFKSEQIHLMKQKSENLKEVVDLVEDYLVYYIHDRPQRKLGGVSSSRSHCYV